MHHIDVCIADDRRDISWRFSGIYSWSESQHRWKTGQLVADLKPRSALPWLVEGDLNEFFSTVRKKVAIQNPKQCLIIFALHSWTIDFLTLGTWGMTSPGAIFNKMVQLWKNVLTVFVPTRNGPHYFPLRLFSTLIQMYLTTCPSF